jgi:hypothetical protein
MQNQQNRTKYRKIKKFQQDFVFHHWQNSELSERPSFTQIYLFIYLDWR